MRVVKQTLPEGHLIASPDCGLGFLGRDLALKKLTNMCEAARRGLTLPLSSSAAPANRAILDISPP